jgi:transposase
MSKQEKTYRETSNVVLLDPTNAQAQLFEQNFGCCRWIYNWGLELKQKLYEDGKQKVSGYDLLNKLHKLKTEYIWLRGSRCRVVAEKHRGSGSSIQTLL